MHGYEGSESAAPGRWRDEPFKRRRLLLVEDNPGDAELVRELMSATQEREREELVHVTTLEAARSALGRDAVDAVLLDLHLPDGEGVDCVRAIRKRARQTPIVVLTGRASDDGLSSIEAGAQDYLSKNGLESETLRRALRYAIARAAEQAARTETLHLQEQLAAIVEASSDAIVSTTPDGKVVSWNQGAERIFGFERAEALGKNLLEIMQPADGAAAAEYERLLRDPARAEGFGAAEALVRPRKDGTLVCLSAVSSVLRDAAGAVTGFSIIARDVTDQKLREDELMLTDRLVSLGTLAAGIAHEINNPLAAVLGNIQLTQEYLRSVSELATGDVLQGLDDARVGADRIRQIVDDLRLFSRADQDRRQVLDVHQVLDSVARMAWMHIRHRARLVKDYGTAPEVWANESRLSQVFLNLLVNAAQAIPEGDAARNEIRITTQATPDGGAAVHVKDTGTGMSADTQRRLFTPFFTTKPLGMGTGLGLAICKRIVSSLGGSIAVESELGRGTTISVVLPPLPEAAPERLRAPSRPVPRASRRARVLVVDDDEPASKLVQRVLGDQHEVIVHTRARIALDELARGERFDVILCDIMMPELSGMAFCRSLEGIDANQARRVVMITGGAATPETRQWLDGASYPRLEKPFDVDHLRAVVNELVESHAAGASVTAP